MSSQQELHQYPGQYSYKGVTYHESFPLWNLKNVEEGGFLQPHHVVIASFVKSGSTWLRAIVNEIQTIGRGEAEDDACSVVDRYPLIEWPRQPDEKNISYDVATNPEIRGIHTHLHASYYESCLNNPDSCPSFVYIMRDPKDVIVSDYHFELKIPFINFNGTFDEFFNKFKYNKMLFGSPIDHILSWQRYNNHPKVHFIKYEDLLMDPLAHIRSLASFLNIDLSEEEVIRVRAATTMSAMKSKGTATFHKNHIDESRGSFFRKGMQGDFRNIMDSTQIEYMDDIIKRTLQPLGLYTVD